MELRVLKYFLVVAQEGNITNAAARLHIGQPTLSRQLKELEQELGQKLFVRQAHGIRLTEAGETLRVSAKEMAAISEKIERDFALAASRPLGDVYVGGIDSYLLENARFMRIARERGINSTIQYTSCGSADALALLDRGLIDFAIVSQIVRVDRYHTLECARKSKWVAVLRRDNPLATQEELTAADLMHEPLLMYENALKAPYELNNLAQWFGNSFSALNIVATSNLTAALLAFASEGLGIMLSWDRIDPFNGENMKAIPLSPELPAQGVLVWRKDRMLSQAALSCLSLIKELMA